MSTQEYKPTTIEWRRIKPGHYVGLGGPLPEDLGGGRRVYRVTRFLDHYDGFYYWTSKVYDPTWLVNDKKNGDAGSTEPAPGLLNPKRDCTFSDAFRTPDEAKDAAVRFETEEVTE